MNGRDKRRRRAAKARAAEAATSVCLNCGEKGRHFVPPSLGEPGFFTCKRPIDDRSRFPNSIPTDLFREPFAHRMIGTRIHQQIEDHLKQLDPNHFRNIDRFKEQ